MNNINFYASNYCNNGNVNFENKNTKNAKIDSNESSKEDKLKTVEAGYIGLILSEEGKKLASQEDNTQESKNNGITDEMMDEYKKQLEAAKKAGKGIEDIGKLMKIARRIANGDKVPASDEKKLMEYNNNLYQSAKAASLVSKNKRPKEYESEFEEENNNENKEKLKELETEDNTYSNDTTLVETQTFEI